MTTLVTGGTGKVGSHLAKLLHAANYAVLITSRKGVAPEPFRAVTFNWDDASTFENPFKADAHIDKLFLVSPDHKDPVPVAKPFMDLALSKGVKRIVLVTASQLEKGDDFYGKLHEYIAGLGVEYTVLRPTWFIENFATTFLEGINKENSFGTVSKTGKVPFIGAEDIAKAAFDALTAEMSTNTDYYVLGPETVSYDQAAEILSEVVGRKITHKQLTNEEEVEFYKSLGMTQEYSEILNELDAIIDDGAEEKRVGTPKHLYTGTRTLRQFFEANKKLWIK
ncbi:hypothetical protein NLJ89_g4862 [Agrocybe chaxingu]|uniref:NmrA-like domain-containing protein n=1 Tax=Agrocybe chaxingu TaxID=84603 RepID=A0A9W8K3A5_9AGAR|nr:hypothetical protein NLJ89_g4862 [Agrocybe chaxingu]